MGSVMKGFISTVALASMLLIMTPVPAQANDCSAAYWWRDLRTPSSNDNEYGVKSTGILVTAVNHCVQHRTLYVYGDSNDFVEIGWYRDGTGGQTLDVCTDTTAPHVLVFQMRNGFKSCKPNTPLLTQGESYSFKIENPDHNYSFSFAWGVGSIPNQGLGAYTTNHKQGQAKASTERHRYEDNLRGTFTGVNSLGSSIWHALPNAVIQQGSDPYPYIVCDWSPSYFRVDTLSGCG